MLVYINGTDNRCNYLAKLMAKDGYQITTNRDELSLCQLCFLGKDGEGFENITFQQNAFVFTLLKNQRLSYLSKLKDFNYACLYHDVDYVRENTRICNEALIAYMIIDNHISLNHANVLILGYGNCGQDLAKKLTSFNAKINIATRNNHYHDLITAQGYRYLDLCDLSFVEYDFIINTIPCNIINEKMLAYKKNTCQIYDIASKPYGLISQLRDTSYHLLKQLPTKYAYKSSALILYQAIEKVCDFDA